LPESKDRLAPAAALEPKPIAEENKEAAPQPDIGAAQVEPSAKEAGRAEARAVDKKKKRAGAGSETAREGAKPAATAAAEPIKPPQAAPATAPSGPDASELMQQAAAAFVRGQMPRARALYRDATSKAPGNADAWRGLGMVSSRMGEREEAKRAFNR